MSNQITRIARRSAGLAALIASLGSHRSAAQTAPEPAAAAAPAPSPAEALVEQGRALLKERGEDGAAEAAARFMGALALDPQNKAALWELGWAQQLLSNWDEAVATWDRLKAVAPDWPELAESYPALISRRNDARALAALPEPKALPEPERAPAGERTLTIRAVGDVQLGRGWPEAQAALPPGGAAAFLSSVAPLLRDADLTFGNLETALADAGESRKCGRGSKGRCYAFRAPTAFAKGLAESGFDVMSVANNHAGDFGPEGRRSTIRALDEAGIKHSGPIGDIAWMQVRGVKVALIAFSFGGGVYQVQYLDLARKVVADVDREADLVVVSFHAGAEGATKAHVPQGTEHHLGENRGDSRAFVRTVIDAGADLVLGHGPHVLRGAEIYKDRLAIYSLGNFSAWESFDLTGPLGISTVLEVTLAENGVALGAKLHPTLLARPGRPVPDPERKAIGLVRKLSQEDFGAPVFDESGAYQRPKQASVP
jgi:hypothetical protein